jgi:hypothetical protein
MIGDVAEAIWELYDEVVDRTPPSELPARGGVVLPDGTYVPCARNSASEER